MLLLSDASVCACVCARTAHFAPFPLLTIGKTIRINLEAVVLSSHHRSAARRYRPEGRIYESKHSNDGRSPASNPPHNTSTQGHFNSNRRKLILTWRVAATSAAAKKKTLTQFRWALPISWSNGKLGARGGRRSGRNWLHFPRNWLECRYCSIYVGMRGCVVT